MNYKEIISEAWSTTQKEKSMIFWFGFLPALLTTTVGVLTVGYQVMAFKTSYLFNEEGGSFFHDVLGFIYNFISSHMSWTLPLIIVLAILAILYFLLPTLTRAGAIQAIARRRNGQKSGVGVGLKYGITSFLPLFEYHLLIHTFSFFTILTEMSFVLRNLGPTIFSYLFPVLLLIMIIGVVLTLLFVFTDFFIVIDDEPVFSSMKKSSKLVMQNLGHTVLISIVMLLIGVRIIIQALIVFLIPLLIVLVTGYIATVTLPITGVIVGIVLGGVVLILSAYLNGIVDIFSYTVWTYAFLDLTDEEELSARASN